VPAIQPQGFDSPVSDDGLLYAPAPPAAWLAEQVAATFGDAALAVLHYGSRAQGRPTRADSAFDYFVVLTEYAEAYAAAARNGACRRPRLAALLARGLPPNSMAIRRSGPFGRQEAKCLLLSRRDFDRACAGRARDHFVLTRMAQRVIVAWSRDPDSSRAVVASMRALHEDTFRWARAFLPTRFDLAEYCQTLIRVPFDHEVRAEPADHPAVLFEAQRELLLGTYAPVLARLAARGVLSAEGGQYRQQRPAGALDRFRIRVYFRRSLFRTTLRLLGQPFLYDGWLEYLIGKIQRSSHGPIELTERERRRPLLFLWPRALRYLRSRPQRGR
jgi:hypothetical protein